jgi:seryl-tRNA synthetase
MLDIRFVRDNPDKVVAAMKLRNAEINLDDFLAWESERREIIRQVEEMKATRNRESEEVARIKKAKGNAEAIILEMRRLGEAIAEQDEKLRLIEGRMQNFLLTIPNIPHASVPAGTDESDNIELRRVGQVPKFNFTPQAHWDIGESLGILDFERGSKVSGARFTFYRGLGAKLERALISFMLDMHTKKHGYIELMPPYLVNAASMLGTGQLPKFEDDAFKCEREGLYLIPTAEVPVTNYHRDEILEEDELPIKYCAYSACFRAEAGAAGRDTRGLIRQHQFNKVELVKFARPEDSYQELEQLTQDAENVLQALGLAYRVVALSSGDMGFASAKTYDIEVWLPSFDCYREISSCSNYEDFQARRANIRYRRNDNGKTAFLHTLNGSGVAIGRTVSAILENYQQEDGSVLIPKALQHYMGNVDCITR